jgi:hypothetical protein
MDDRWQRESAARAGRSTDALDLDALLHPADAFVHPTEVVNDPDLTLNEKRAILASWASDACAVEAAPALRQTPGAGKPVRVDDIMEALRALDKQARQQVAPPHYRNVLARRVRGIFGRGSRSGDTGGQDCALN